MSPSMFLAATMPSSASVRSGLRVGDFFKSPAMTMIATAMVVPFLVTISPVSMLPELFIGIAGALAYGMMKLQSPVVTRKRKVANIDAAGPVAPSKAKPRRKADEAQPRIVAPKRQQPKPVVRQPSVVPVLNAQFQSCEWESEVQELLCQIAPTRESDQAVAKITNAVRKNLRPLLPEAEVVGVATGNLHIKKAFGVAVPEVDIVVTASPSMLVDRLQTRIPNGAYLAKLDAKKLQKSAVRACADELVSVGGFKFRRSAFRGEEPKFTLVAPHHLTGSEETIAVDFSVNTAMPLRCAALFEECGRLDSRAKDLVLLLRRWARDRGIAHAARGHLPPYAWTLLTVYFLQVGVGAEAILPPFDGLEDAISRPSKTGTASDISVASLFKRCLAFYAAFDWRAEGVSVRTGRRAPPPLSLPIHVTVGDEGKTAVAPSIEDPFGAAGRNVASCMSAEGVVRLQEEFARARKFCEQGEPLAKLLELWAPPAPEPQDAVAIS